MVSPAVVVGCADFTTVPRSAALKPNAGAGARVKRGAPRIYDGLPASNASNASASGAWQF